MRRFLAVVLGVTLVAGAASGAGSSPRPSVKLASMAPVKVHGLHFKARERVRVSVSYADGSTVRTVRTGSTGTFTTVFTNVSVERCGSGLLVIRALGRLGDRAYLKVALPECPPA